MLAGLIDCRETSRASQGNLWQEVPNLQVRLKAEADLGAKGAGAEVIHAWTAGIVIL